MQGGCDAHYYRHPLEVAVAQTFLLSQEQGRYTTLYGHGRDTHRRFGDISFPHEGGNSTLGAGVLENETRDNKGFGLGSGLYVGLGQPIAHLLCTPINPPFSGVCSNALLDDAYRQRVQPLLLS